MAYFLHVTNPRRMRLIFATDDAWAHKLADVTKAQLAMSGASTTNTLRRCDDYLQIACSYRPARIQRNMGLLHRMRTKWVPVRVRTNRRMYCKQMQEYTGVEMLFTCKYSFQCVTLYETGVNTGLAERQCKKLAYNLSQLLSVIPTTTPIALKQ
jgi:hypothetical protein